MTELLMSTASAHAPPVIASNRVGDLRREIADAGGLFTRAGLAKRWGLSRTAVGNMTAKASFPSPIYVDRDKEVWLAEEADAWRDDQRA